MFWDIRLNLEVIDLSKRHNGSEPVAGDRFLKPNSIVADGYRLTISVIKTRYPKAYDTTF